MTTFLKDIKINQDINPDVVGLQLWAYRNADRLYLHADEDPLPLPEPPLPIPDPWPPAA